MRRITLSLQNKYCEMDRVHAEVDQLGREFGWTADLIFRLKLVLSEAVNNIVRHGYRCEGDKPILLTLTVEHERLEIRIKDQARPFLIQEHQVRSADPLSECGRGIFLIKQLVDDAYSTREEGWNELVLVKNLKDSCLTTCS